jgi:subtilisin family serine protease
MVRQVVVGRAIDLLPPDAMSKERSELLSEIGNRLAGMLGGFKGFEVLATSLDWQPRLTEKVNLTPERVSVSLKIGDPADLKEFRKAVEDTNNRVSGATGPLEVGADLSLAESEYFCPGNVDQLLFGDRSDAAALTNSALLQQRNLTGRGVNIVVIDEGFNAAGVSHYGGGLININNNVPPGATTRGHGLMMIRNIIAAAPDATFYDVPLIPLRISDVNGFIGDALGAFLQLKYLIDLLRQSGTAPGPWILVNAWSIFDRSTEHPLGDYTENPYHPLNVLIDQMVDDGIDIIFAAGNCGQFCPDIRCGERDVGPGHSIYGANSHRRVLTTGAVRTDAIWVGRSSQGPGQPALSRWKPDLCAPSHFREVGDASLGNLSEPFVGATGSPYIASTGTSAACGLTAGIVGAIRSGWNQTVLPPDKLRYLLNQTARKTEGPNWNERLGHGIIDVEAVLTSLP